MSNAWGMAAGRLGLIAVLCGVIVGCETIESTVLLQSAPQDATLAPDEQTGVLVIGMDHQSYWLGGYRDVHKLIFWTYDPETRRLIPPEQGGSVIVLARGNSLDRPDVDDGIQYILQLFPAGDYYLTTVLWGPHGGAPMTQGSITFSVKPGAITYVGNIDFKTPLLVFQQVGVNTIGRDNRAAEAMLAKYPNLDGEIWHQELKRLQLDCDLERGFETCYVAAPGS